MRTEREKELTMAAKHNSELSNEDLRSNLSEEELKCISGGFLGGKIAIIAVLIGM